MVGLQEKLTLIKKMYFKTDSDGICGYNDSWETKCRIINLMQIHPDDIFLQPEDTFNNLATNESYVDFLINYYRESISRLRYKTDKLVKMYKFLKVNHIYVNPYIQMWNTSNKSILTEVNGIVLRNNLENIKYNNYIEFLTINSYYTLSDFYPFLVSEVKKSGKEKCTSDQVEVSVETLLNLYDDELDNSNEPPKHLRDKVVLLKALKRSFTEG